VSYLYIASFDGLLGEADNEWVRDRLEPHLSFYQAYPCNHAGFVFGSDMSYLEDVSNILSEIYDQA
jgi:hypothetical protein